MTGDCRAWRARRRGPRVILGLTGSIGMGKSPVAAMFVRLGVPLFDADAEVHRLQRDDAAIIAAVEARFPGTTGPGGVDRRALGAAVLGRPDALAALERIIHPAVAASRRRFLRRHRAAPLVVLDIPLLFEKGGDRAVDLVAVVSAAGWQQRRRVLARPGMTAARFRTIRRLQTPDHVKRARADILIPTGGTFAATRAQVRAIVSCLGGPARAYSVQDA